MAHVHLSVVQRIGSRLAACNTVPVTAIRGNEPSRFAFDWQQAPWSCAVGAARDLTNRQFLSATGNGIEKTLYLLSMIWDKLINVAVLAVVGRNC